MTDFVEASHAAIRKVQDRIAHQNRLMEAIWKHSPTDCEEGRHIIDIISDVEIRRGRPSRVIMGCVICLHLEEVSD